MGIKYEGMGRAELTEMLQVGRDHGGSPVEPFVDSAGGWPLRCCLKASVEGDRIAIVGFSPFPWDGPYRETGPVVIHADGCRGSSGAFPERFETRDQVVRAFGDDAGRRHTQVYDLNRVVPARTGLRSVIESVLADDRVEFVHVHNLVAQCFSFAAYRLPEDHDATTPGVGGVGS